MKRIQIVFLALFSSAIQLLASMPQAVDLRCDYRVNPLGIDRIPPKLSWRMDTEQTTGNLQTAYQIRSAATKQDLAGGNLLWDSGTVQSGQCTLIPYDGPKLMPRQRIWWQVKIYDNKGNESSWSEPAWFETGLMEEKNWQGALWIGSDRDPNKPQDAPDQYMGDWIVLPEGKSATEIFTELTLPDKKIVSAIAWRGLSRNVGKCFFSENSHNMTELSSNGRMGFFDMAFFLRPGQTNRLSVKFSEPVKGFALTYGMRILYADGSQQIIRSGRDWKAVAGDETVSMEVAEPYGGPTYGKAQMFNMTDLPPMWYRSGIEVNGAVKRARLYLCALGQGVPYLNGKPIDDQLMGVPQTDYEEFAYYTTHDITDQLKQGTNTLAVLLDAGWFHEVGGFGFHQFTYGKPGLKSLVIVEYENGRSRSFISGTDWQFKEGALRSANIYRGERIDYRLDQQEWKQVGTGTGWKPALAIPPCTPKTVAMDVEPVRKTETLSPVKTWQTGPKTWLFDIGQTINGWVRFSFHEPEDTVIYLRYSEYAKNGVMENVPNSHWLCHRVMQSDWITADGKPHVYETTFAPKSFRYVEICGLSSKPDDLTAYVVHSDLPQVATFKSSNPMLNRLFANAMRTWRNYITHVFGDLPRERCLWGAESIYTEVVGGLCIDMAPTHRLMDTLWLTGRMTPEGIPGNIAVGKRLTTSTQGYVWSVTPVFISSFLYDHYGDLEPARVYYNKLLDIINYPKTHGLRDGTIPVPTDLTDHAAIKSVKRNPVNNELLTAMIYYEALNRFARLSDALGKTNEAEQARSQAMKVHETILSFYDHENHTFGNGTEDSLALAYNLFDDPSEQKALARSLVGYYKANGHRWDGGFLSFEVYPQLVRYGYVDDALAMLLNTDSPGPAQTVKDYDATTYYETYWDIPANQKFVGQDFIAFTHSAGWMITDLAGISYQTPAPSRTQLMLEPHFAKDLDFVESSVEMPTGTVKSSWQRKNGTISWNVTIPPNTETTVKLPQTDIANVTINEQSLKDADIDVISNQDKNTFALKSGTWDIVLTSIE